MDQNLDIIMPVKNSQDTLPACLESIESQTFSANRLIAIDDGSADASLSILNAYAAGNPNVLVLESEGRGIVAALNTGIENSDAPFIARMDADDVMHPDRLEKQVAHLNEHTNVGVVSSLVDEDGFDGGFEHYLKWSNGLITPDEIAKARFIESPVVHPTVMFRRELIDSHGGYRDGDFPEDYELWLRWMDAGVRFGKVNEPLLSWSDEPGRLTRTDPRYSVDAFFKTKLFYLAQWLEKNNPHGKHVWVWGAGSVTRKRLRALAEHGIVIDGLIDVDPDKIGQATPDGKVYAPDDLPGPESSFVLSAVGSRGARELITADLNKRGYAEGRNFLSIA